MSPCYMLYVICYAIAEVFPFQLLTPRGIAEVTVYQDNIVLVACTVLQFIITRLGAEE